MSDNTIPLWLSLIAVASILQVTMLVVVAVVVARNARKVQDLAAEIRREQITPLVTRAHQAIDEVQSVVARVRTYDDEIRHAVERAGDSVHRVTDLVRVGSSPVVGFVRGATAALSVLFNGRNDSRTMGAGGTGHARY